jgi:hypothetical protein
MNSTLMNLKKIWKNPNLWLIVYKRIKHLLKLKAYRNCLLLFRYSCNLPVIIQSLSVRFKLQCTSNFRIYFKLIIPKIVSE